MRIRIALILALLQILVAGCNPPAGTTQGTTSTATSSPTSTGQTAGQLAAAGQAVFASTCAPCHGDSGQGITAPAVIGASASLAKYATGQGLFTKISTTMPFNAPASLGQQQYLQVTAYLLLQNNYVTADSQLSSDTLSGVSLAP